MKILYVEDNDDNVYMLKNRLTRAGFTIVVATDGARGVAMATTEKPDLILMDLTLPDSSKARAHLFRITTSTTRVGDPRSGYVDSAQSRHHPRQFIVRSRRYVEGAQSYDAKESSRQRTERITGLYARNASGADVLGP